MAQFNLAACDALGIGVAQDDAESLRWCRLAAEKGVAKAQTKLARLGL
jgi:TPR repeat protein